MIASTLAALGLTDAPIPTSHADRQAHLAEFKKKREAARASRVGKAEREIAEENRGHDEDVAAEQAKVEAAALKLDGAMAKAGRAALVPLFVNFFETPSRSLAATVGEAVRQLEAQSQDTLGAALDPWQLSVGAAQAITKVRPEMLSAFTSEEAFGSTHGVVDAAGRLLNAALAGESPAVLHAAILALEERLELRCKYEGGKPVTKENAERFALICDSSRPATRVERLRECAERYGKARQQGFADSYVLPAGPILSQPWGTATAAPAVDEDALDLATVEHNEQLFPVDEDATV